MCSSNQSNVCAALRDFDHFLNDIFASRVIYEMLGSTSLDDQVSLGLCINAYDPQSACNCILAGEMAQSAAGARNYDPLTREEFGELEVLPDCQTGAPVGGESIRGLGVVPLSGCAYRIGQACSVGTASGIGTTQ